MAEIKLSLPKFNSGYILGRKRRIRVEAAMPHELVPYQRAMKDDM